MVGDDKPDVIPEFFYFCNILSAGGGCELAVVTGCKCACTLVNVYINLVVFMCIDYRIRSFLSI